MYVKGFILLRSAEFWGGRMASAEGGSVPNGVGYGEGVPSSAEWAD